MICLKILDPILKNQEKCGSSLIEINFNIVEIIQIYQNMILCEKYNFLFFFCLNFCSIKVIFLVLLIFHTYQTTATRLPFINYKVLTRLTDIK